MRAFGVVKCQSGLGVIGISVVLPGGDFVDEGLFVGDAAVEAPRTYASCILLQAPACAALDGYTRRRAPCFPTSSRCEFGEVAPSAHLHV